MEGSGKDWTGQDAQDEGLTLSNDQVHSSLSQCLGEASDSQLT